MASRRSHLAHPASFCSPVAQHHRVSASAVIAPRGGHSHPLRAPATGTPAAHFAYVDASPAAAASPVHQPSNRTEINGLTINATEGFNHGWGDPVEGPLRSVYSFPPAAYAADPAESRNRRIDSRNIAIWFQVGMLGDATAFFRAGTPPKKHSSVGFTANSYQRLLPLPIG